MATKLRREEQGDVVHLVLARPDVRNAMDEDLIAELDAALRAVGDESPARAVVLRGEGKVFCAGADLGTMRAKADASHEENLEDAHRLGALFAAISECPRPVLALVHGAALGGGLGLVAAADIVIAAEGTRFGFTETRLGIVPGVISPYAVRRLGPARCRRLFLTAEIFEADVAERFGLVDEVVAPEQLDAALDRWIDRLRVGGPQAQGAAKRLLDEITALPVAEALRRTPEHIARQRATDEAREGFAAFFEKRPARWTQRPGKEDR